jgi:anti-sigma-K factor RskA
MIDDEFVTYDAAYVLGALSDDDRRRYEAHLQTCDQCLRAVRSLQHLPPLLATISPEDFADEPVPAPATLLPTLLDDVRQSRRRRRYLTAALASVAAACLVLAGVFAWRARETSTAPSATAAGTVVALSAPPGEEVAVMASARLQTVGWGTRIELSCRHTASGTPYPGDADYQLVVVDRNGVSQPLGSWRLPPDKNMTYVAGTAVTADRIAQLQITTLSGTPLLTGKP